MLRHKRYKFLFVILSVIFIYFFHSTFVVTFITRTEKNKIGIIDYNIKRVNNDRLIYQGQYSDAVTHGNRLIDYLHVKHYKGDIYYYSAESKTGKINSKKIINGLNWMKYNGVRYINISLSSKYYSEDLAKWINSNKDIVIFCSYNNQNNTADYPANYKNTIASLQKGQKHKNVNCVIYRSNNIIVINKRIYYYKGNSFLSIESLLNYNK